MASKRCKGLSTLVGSIGLILILGLATTFLTTTFFEYTRYMDTVRSVQAIEAYRLKESLEGFYKEATNNTLNVSFTNNGPVDSLIDYVYAYYEGRREVSVIGLNQPLRSGSTITLNLTGLNAVNDDNLTLKAVTRLGNVVLLKRKTNNDNPSNPKVKEEPTNPISKPLYLELDKPFSAVSVANASSPPKTLLLSPSGPIVICADWSSRVYWSYWVPRGEVPSTAGLTYISEDGKYAFTVSQQTMQPSGLYLMYFIDGNLVWVDFISIPSHLLHLPSAVMNKKVGTVYLAYYDGYLLKVKRYLWSAASLEIVLTQLPVTGRLNLTLSGSYLAVSGGISLGRVILVKDEGSTLKVLSTIDVTDQVPAGMAQASYSLTDVNEAADLMVVASYYTSPKTYTRIAAFKLSNQRLLWVARSYPSGRPTSSSIGGYVALAYDNGVVEAYDPIGGARLGTRNVGYNTLKVRDGVIYAPGCALNHKLEEIIKVTLPRQYTGMDVASDLSTVAVGMTSGAAWIPAPASSFKQSGLQLSVDYTWKPLYIDTFDGSWVEGGYDDEKWIGTSKSYTYCQEGSLKFYSPPSSGATWWIRSKRNWGKGVYVFPIEVLQLAVLAQNPDYWGGYPRTYDVIPYFTVGSHRVYLKFTIERTYIYWGGRAFEAFIEKVYLHLLRWGSEVGRAEVVSYGPYETWGASEEAPYRVYNMRSGTLTFKATDSGVEVTLAGYWYRLGSSMGYKVITLRDSYPYQPGPINVDLFFTQDIYRYGPPYGKLALSLACVRVDESSETLSAAFNAPVYALDDGLLAVIPRYPAYLYDGVQKSLKIIVPKNLQSTLLVRVDGATRRQIALNVEPYDANNYAVIIGERDIVSGSAESTWLLYLKRG